MTTTWTTRAAMLAAVVTVASSAVALGTGAASQPAGEATAQTVSALPAAPPEGDVVLFDDFDGTRLDRSVWNVEVTGVNFGTVNNEQQAYVDSPRTLRIARRASLEGASGGALEIHPRYRPGFQAPDGRTYDFISGRLTTQEKVELTYGTAEARIKLPDGSGLWPAFWSLGSDIGTAGWPGSGETDIMEYVGYPEWTSNAVHGPGYSGETPLVTRQYFPEGTDATDWHVYSVTWSPTEMVFRLDGEITYRATRPMAEFFGPWAFDTDKFLLLNFALGGAYPVKNNNEVDAQYYGIPEDTVADLQREEPKMLVDWVRVTSTD